jgi:hypothetical protein
MTTVDQIKNGLIDDEEGKKKCFANDLGVKVLFKNDLLL